jgi:hypothetical protein
MRVIYVVFTACLATVVLLLRDVMFTACLATVVLLFSDAVFTKALPGNAAESCLLLPSNHGIPCYITAAMVA